MTDKTVNILLLEDDEIDAEAVKRAFKKHKIANPLTVARDGLEALDYLKGENGKEKIAEPLLCLVDINMPRMNGIEFLQAIRADEAHNKTIAFILTTSKSDEDKMMAYDLNVAGYLVKSNVGKDFLKMIEMLDHYWRVIEFP